MWTTNTFLDKFKILRNSLPFCNRFSMDDEKRARLVHTGRREMAESAKTAANNFKKTADILNSFRDAFGTVTQQT
jgi:hypothetical protein